MMQQAKTDNKIVKAICTVVALAESISIEYIIFGSCGIQSYLPYFFRIPNDIDLVLREKDINLFLSTCNKKKFKIIEEIGRYKIYVNEFPVHIIPEVFSIVNKEDSSIFAKISLKEAFERAPCNSFNFLYSENSIIGNVMPLDYIFFMELDRKQDTNTFYSIIALLVSTDLSLNDVSLLINKHANLESRIAKSIFWLREKLENEPYIPFIDNALRLKVLDKLNYFNNTLAIV